MLCATEGTGIWRQTASHSDQITAFELSHGQRKLYDDALGAALLGVRRLPLLSLLKVHRTIVIQW